MFERVGQFSLSTKQLQGSGEDTLSGIAGVNQTTTNILVKDKAGNTAQFNITSKRNITSTYIGTQNMTISGLFYNNKAATIPQSTIIVGWTMDKTGAVKYLLQTYIIKGEQSTSALYGPALPTDIWLSYNFRGSAVR